MPVYTDIPATIGRTPLLDITPPDAIARVLCKLEFCNPLGSVKDRIGRSMIEAALEDGRIGKGSLVVEPTSGNTGIALAAVCAAKGIRITLTMPETMSDERKKLLRFLGADLVLTPGAGGMKAAIAEAVRITEKTPDAFMPDQFANPANPKAHMETTAEEIWADTQGKVDVLVAGVGTGGTITGITRVMKERLPEFTTIAVEPAESPVLSGGTPGPHAIQGIGAGFVPAILDVPLLDEVMTIAGQKAIETAQQLAATCGILCGISSGAAAFAAWEVARRREMEGKTIVTVLPSTGERYLSTPLFAGVAP